MEIYLFLHLIEFFAIGFLFSTILSVKLSLVKFAESLQVRLDKAQEILEYLRENDGNNRI
jgi:hypothetical protein